MHLTKEERNTVVSFFCLLVALFFFFSVFLIPARGNILQSARLMPGIVSVVMILLGGAFFIRSAIQARPGLRKLKGSVIAVLKSREWRNIFLSIGMVAVYVFLGVPYLGYYVSSVVLVLFISLYYVRRVHPLVSVISSGVITGMLYLIFSVVFKIPLQ